MYVNRCYRFSILANSWLIDLSIWLYPIGPNQPYVVKMKPDDVLLFLLCVGQIIAEIAAGTIALLMATSRHSMLKIKVPQEKEQ